MKSRPSLRVITTFAIVGLVLIGAGVFGFNPLTSDDSGASGLTTEKIPYPPGYSKSGVNTTKALDQHNTALSGHDSFTRNFKHTFPKLGSNKTTHVTEKINFREERRYKIAQGRVEESQSSHNEMYYDGNNRYWMEETVANENRYRVGNGSPISRERFNETWIDDMLANTSFDKGKQVTRDGETLIRYNSDSTTNAKTFIPYDTKEQVDINEFKATLLVDKDGVIREFRFSFKYEPDTFESQLRVKSVTGTYKVTDIDSTTIERPDWVANASKEHS